MSRKRLLQKKKIYQQVVTGGMNAMGPHDGDSKFYADYFRKKQTDYEVALKQARLI